MTKRLRKKLAKKQGMHKGPDPQQWAEAFYKRSANVFDAALLAELRRAAGLAN